MGEQRLGMRRVEDDELAEAVRQLRARRPADDPAPVVSNEVEAIDPEGVCKTCEVAEELGKRIGAYALRLIARVVAPLVGNDDAISGGGERRDLPGPADPEVGKTVKEDDGTSIGRSGLDNMQAKVSGMDITVNGFARHHGESTPKLRR